MPGEAGPVMRSSGGALTAGSLLAGWCADRLLGDPPHWHPVAGFGALATAWERVWWRPSLARGLAYAAVLVGGAGAAVCGLDHLAGRSWLRRLAVGSLVTWAALGGRSLERAGEHLAAALDAGDLNQARRLLPTLAGRDPSTLDANELSRAGIESVAENTADAVVGPLLWGALGGPGAMAAYRAANTLDAMVGHHSERYERFGWAAARFDDLAGWLPARFAACLAVLLAPLAGGDRGQAWRTLRRDGAAHPSPNAGRLEAAFAGALGVRLGGTNRYGDRVEHRPLLGDGRAPEAEDLRRAVRLSRLTGLAAAALTALAAATVRPAATVLRRWAARR